MRNGIRIALAGLGMLVLAASLALAVRDSGVVKAAISPYELLVFQRDPCTYCEAFRRDVAPVYGQGPLAIEAPLRFVDIDKTDVAKLRLITPLTVLPTTVLMKNGAEVARIPGMTAASTFSQLVQMMVTRAK
jgi:thiol-disulfide isomerase/thioredoxin